MRNLGHNQNKLKQNLINFCALLSEWFIIISILIFQYKTPNTPLLLKLLFMMIIASRVHALGILMHEASHYNLFSNKWVNDCLVQFFISLPLFISLKGYRTSHDLHHQFSLTEKDPTFVRKFNKKIFEFPKKSHLRLIKDLLAVLLGFGLLMNFSDLKRNQTTKIKSKLLSYLKLIIFISLLGLLWKMKLLMFISIYWLIPNFTFLPLINYWRTVAEHLSLTSEYNVRTVIYHPLLAWFIAPYNIALHAEHHRFAKVKWYQLSKIKFNYSQHKNAHKTEGLKYLWLELVGKS